MSTLATNIVVSHNKCIAKFFCMVLQQTKWEDALANVAQADRHSGHALQGSAPVVMQEGGKPTVLDDSQRKEQTGTAQAQYQQYCQAQ